LLQGYEEEAQVTWMSPMVEGKPEEVEEWTEELIQILEAEALRQTNQENLKLSWLIRQHIREIAPSFINNLLHLIQLSIDLDDFTPERIAQWQVAAVLQQSDSEQVDSMLLLQVLKNSLEFPAPETLAFVEASLPHYSDNSGIFIDNLMLIAVKLAYKTQEPLFAASVAELCLKLNPEHPEALRHLSCFYINARRYQQAVETARRFFNNCLSTVWQVQGSSLMLLALLKSGAWLEAEPVLQRHKLLIKDLLQNPPETIEPSYASYLLLSNFFLP
jgi:predicted O-linked N-acetylglucosamine transferase (SPINDLY family)